jgi:hypothetical protein
MTRFVLILAVAACSKGNASGTPDAAPKRDAPPEIDAPAVYAHTIQIDGVDDFLSAEQFPTTSTGYDARVTWDAQNIYVGYSGADFDPAVAQSNTKWLFIYVDADPGGPNGAAVNEVYNTQGATFPSGFRADFYMRWRCDAALLTLKQYTGSAWAESASAPSAARGGTFVEFALPRNVIGNGNVNIVTWMINEQNGAESSYAGLYAGNFTDGYAANLALSKFLKIDFAALRDPNAPANEGP